MDSIEGVVSGIDLSCVGPFIAGGSDRILIFVVSDS